jgi:hypothetical protein
MSIGELEKKIGEAALFHRLAASSIHVHRAASFEYVRAARDVLASAWMEMENAGEFPQVLMDRIMEIEHGLVAVVIALMR